MNSFVDIVDDSEAVDVHDDLSPEQRAYWEASIERDIREIAEGKPQTYITLEQFDEELRAAIACRI